MAVQFSRIDVISDHQSKHCGSPIPTTTTATLYPSDAIPSASQLQHRLGCGYFGDPACWRRFDVDDDRPLQIDQVISAIGEADPYLPFVGPGCCRSGERGV